MRFDLRQILKQRDIQSRIPARRIVLFLLIVSLLAIVLLAGTGVLIPQEDQGQTLACDEEALIAEQHDLQASLENFADALQEDSEVALGTLYDVGQRYQELALECGYIPENIGELVVGTDVEQILTALEEINGDPLQGQLLYNNEENVADGSVLGCVGCHNEGETGPATAGTWTRWDEIRSLEPEFEGYTFEHYAVESIVLPWQYIVPGYGEVMPNNFGNRLSYQDLADLVAYLSSQDQYLD